jgi:cytochrome c2
MRDLADRRRRGLLLIVAALLCTVVCTGCGAVTAMQQVPGGNADRGATAIQSAGCGTCHIISGISGANGKVGPSLSGIADQEYIAGRLRNTPENMIHWLQDPQEVDPGVDMPDMGLSAADARDIAQYLYTLR